MSIDNMNKIDANEAIKSPENKESFKESQAKLSEDHEKHKETLREKWMSEKRLNALSPSKLYTERAINAVNMDPSMMWELNKILEEWDDKLSDEKLKKMWDLFDQIAGSGEMAA